MNENNIKLAYIQILINVSFVKRCIQILLLIFSFANNKIIKKM